MKSREKITHVVYQERTIISEHDFDMTRAVHFIYLSIVLQTLLIIIRPRITDPTFPGGWGTPANLG